MENTVLAQKLAQVRCGDKAAFEEIYRQLSTPLFTVILRIVQNRAAAEDVFQEVFVKLYQTPPPDTVANPRAYLFQMAHNLAIDSLRKLRPTSEWESVQLGHMQEEQMAEKLDIEQAMGTLDCTARQIVSLHLNAGLKFREIASIVGLPLGTVLWKYQKAIKALQAYLKGGTE